MLQIKYLKKIPINKKIKLSVATSSIRTVSKFGGIDEFLTKTKSKKLSLKAKTMQRPMEIAASKINPIVTNGSCLMYV